jgi:trk system potassium uptake protein TrkH
MGRIHPIRFVVTSFALIILSGAILLWLPVSSQSGQFTPFVNCLFTATSATCVTGLVVVDTGTYWSWFGQIVILLLIQIGGLGYITMATFIPLALGRKVGLVDRIRLVEALNVSSLRGIIQLVRYVLLIVLITEGLGALILFLRFLQDMPVGMALYRGIFHAVSAFCNAGFDVLGPFSGPYSSLTYYRGDAVVNLTVGGLIIMGGIGFIVIANLIRHFRMREPIHLQSKIVLLMTTVLVVGGTLFIFLMEFSNPNTLAPLPLGEKILASFFQSVTPRTAGFNTLNLGGMNVSTLMLLVILMFIGASPGGTGGGVKTSTLAVILAAVRATIRGQGATILFGRHIEFGVIAKALSIVVISFFLVTVVSVVMAFLEPFAFHQLLFEVTSGFGTVGLSTGITPSLTTAGKALIMFIVFAGRVGPLSLFIALTQRKKEVIRVKYPEETVLVG